MLYPDLFALLHCESEDEGHIEPLSTHAREQISNTSNVKSSDRPEDLVEHVTQKDKLAAG